MKHLLLATCLMCSVSVAHSQSAPKNPDTILLPTPLMQSLAQYLSQRPYSEVAQIIAAIQECITIQVQQGTGVVMSHGECPAVYAVITAKAAAPVVPPEPTKAPTTDTPGR